MSIVPNIVSICPTNNILYKSHSIKRKPIKNGPELIYNIYCSCLHLINEIFEINYIFIDTTIDTDYRENRSILGRIYNKYEKTNTQIQINRA